MMKPDSFELQFPLDRTHCGIPLANGNVGALIWGSENLLCITVNRADCWDHRVSERVLPGATYQQLVDSFDPLDITPTNRLFKRNPMPLDRDGFWWRSTRVPIGRFEFALDGLLARARLNYDTGVLIITTDSGRALQLTMCRQSGQLLVQDPDRLITRVHARPSWEWVGDLLKQAGYQPPAVREEQYLCGWFQPFPADPGAMALCIGEPGRWNLTVRRESEPRWSIDRPAEWDATLKANRHWWQQFWATVPHISLPQEPWLEQFYQFALFKFACATDPAGVACGLQGPWVEEYQRAQWSADYHFNVNVQQVYTLALSIGAYQHMMPLFDMLESDAFQRTMRENARNLFGIDDGLLMTHAVDDRGMQVGGIQAGSVLDFACGGWTAQLYWLYFKHTGDIEFLRQRALPFMRGVMRVYEAALREHEGRLSIPLAISAEYGFIFPVVVNGKPRSQNAGRDPSNQLMCAHMLASALLEACDVLQIAPNPIWQEIQRRLPLYTLGGNPGQEHILIWEGQDLDVCHRHHSHLAMIYPFATYNPADPEQARVVSNTVDHWIFRGMGQWSEWCYPWAAIIHARMGFSESPMQLLRLWRDLFINEAWATVYLPRFQGLTVHRRADMLKPKATSEIMQLDGTMAGATAILEMLAHEQAGVIHLFRGLPAQWTDAEFTNIRLPGGIRISATMKRGKLSDVRLTGPRACTMPVEFRGQRFDCQCVCNRDGAAEHQPASAC